MEDVIVVGEFTLSETGVDGSTIDPNSTTPISYAEVKAFLGLSNEEKLESARKRLGILRGRKSYRTKDGKAVSFKKALMPKDVLILKHDEFLFPEWVFEE